MHRSRTAAVVLVLAALFGAAGRAQVRSCESLASVALPNTTIESAAIEPADGSCRVAATVTHPPGGDRVKIFIGLPMKG